MSCSEHEVLAVGVLCFFAFCEAQQVLDEFQDEFIHEMDSNAVVLDLLYHNIISDGDQRTITMTIDQTQQNKFLHFYLRKCTEDAFHLVCDIISEVKGNPRMSALGTAMRRRLETGKRVCMWVCGCVCMWVGVHTYIRMHVCVRVWYVTLMFRFYKTLQERSVLHSLNGNKMNWYDIVQLSRTVGRRIKRWQILW